MKENNKNGIMIIAGTRPEAIKLAPVLEELKRLKVEYTFVWSGQHYDYEMSRVFFEQLDLPDPDEIYDVKSKSPIHQIGAIMAKLEESIEKYKPSIIVSEGDTNTVVATAFTSVMKQIPFAHVEAGLRSWDRTMPEEINRIIADSIAQIHFAPTEWAAVNLMHEGVGISKIHITGNTVVDILHKYKRKAVEIGRKLISSLDLEPKEYLLVTVHRQENTDSISRLSSIIKSLGKLSNHYPVVFSVHPRTIRRIKEYGLYDMLSNNRNLILLKPLGYFEFLGLLAQTKIVLTDSGGVQEEACTLKIPTITLRYNTERPESVMVGINRLVGTETDKIVSETLNIIDNYNEVIKKIQRSPNPFGDGKAGKRIAEILKYKLEKGLEVETIDSRKNPYITYRLIEDIKQLQSHHNIVSMYNDDGFPVVQLEKANKLIVRTDVSGKCCDDL